MCIYGERHGYGACGYPDDKECSEEWIGISQWRRYRDSGQKSLNQPVLRHCQVSPLPTRDGLACKHA